VPVRVVTSAGSDERFCLDDIDVVRSLESNQWVDEMCPRYQFCEQRGSWGEEALRRAKSTLTAAKQLVRSLQGAAKMQKDSKAAAAAAKRRAAEAAAAARKPAMSKQEKDELEVRRVMDRMLNKVEGVAAGAAKHVQRTNERLEIEDHRQREKAEREAARERDKADRGNRLEVEKMGREAVKERERVEREAAKERERADKEETKEKEKDERDAAREVARVAREQEKELEKSAKALEREAAKDERDKRKAEETSAAAAVRAKEMRASQWLHGVTPREPDATPTPASVSGSGCNASPGTLGPDTTPPPPCTLDSFSNTPELSGDLLEVQTMNTTKP
jgi:hypothetical protein